MNFKSMLQRAAPLFEVARGLRIPRLPFAIPASGDGRDIARTAVAGAILFGLAGAGLGASGGFNTFRVDAAAAGATVSVGWGYDWLAYAVFGAMAGAAVGAGATFAALRWFRPRAAMALLAVGAVGGILAGSIWGSAVARERVVEVRAQHASAAPLLSARGPSVSVVNGPVRLSGTVARDMNFPLLAFMVIGGTVVGALAARGLAEKSSFEQRTGRAQKLVPPVPWAQSDERAHAGVPIA
jgi:hypothetical protein